MKREGDRGFQARREREERGYRFTDEEKRMGRNFSIKFIIHISVMTVLTIVYLVIVVGLFIMMNDLSIYDTIDETTSLVKFIIIVSSMFVGFILLLEFDEFLARKMGLHKFIALRDVNRDGVVNAYDDPRYRSMVGTVFAFIFGVMILMLVGFLALLVPLWFILPPLVLIIMFYMFRLAGRNRWELP